MRRRIWLGLIGVALATASLFPLTRSGATFTYQEPGSSKGREETKPIGLPDFDIRLAGKGEFQDYDLSSASGKQSARENMVTLEAASAVDQFASFGAAQNLRAVVNETGAMKNFFINGATLSSPKKGKPDNIARNFLAQHPSLFQLAPEDVANLKLTNADVDRGTSFLTYVQTIGDLKVFDGGVQVVVNKRGEVLSVREGFLVDGQAVSLDSRLTETQALTKAFEHAGRKVDGVFTEIQARATKGELSVYANPLGSNYENVLSDLTVVRVGDSARLAWHVYTDAGSNEWYEILVDADTGELLFRNNLYVFDAQGTVYTVHPDFGPRQLLSFVGDTVINTAAGWMGASTVTTGNNVEAYLDTDANNSPDPINTSELSNGHASSATQDFTFPFSIAVDPRTQQAAVVTNLFYFNNIMHDFSYGLGFTETARNFQTNNYGRGGLQNDSVQAEAQDGSGTNNANFATPPDGTRPRMQQYLFTAPTPDRDSSVDSDVVYHEYGHGISNRLIGNASGLDGTQSRAMGEGWSDYWACTLNNDGVMGEYVTQDPVAGIRRAAYSVPADPVHDSYADVCVGGCQVHRDGEVWAATLFDLRNELGAAISDNLVLNGMKFTPSHPSFLNARDGILQADQNLYAGANHCVVWTVFARHGMGWSAVGNDGSIHIAATDLPVECGGSGCTFTPIAVGQTINAALTAADCRYPTGSNFYTDPYTFDGIAGQKIAITMTSGDFDTKLALQDPNGTEVTSDNDGGGGTNSRIPANSGFYTLLSTGVYTIQATSNLVDATGNYAVTLTRIGLANYDSVLKVPKCAVVGSVCDTGALVFGRDNLATGPELHQPNTINNSCADGTSGTFHDDESVDAIKVSTLDGSNFAPGKTVQIEVSYWAWSTTADTLEIFYAADATNPTWVSLGSFLPPATGAQIKTVNYQLPAGALQAVRARFRFQGVPGACATNSGFDEADDLIFATEIPPTCNDTVWFDDAVPTGATEFGSNDGWNWVGSNPTPFSGTLAHQSGIISGQHDHYFTGATATMPLASGDVIFAYVYLDPANMPQEIMLSFHDGAWGYRAYWGADLLPYGTNGTGSRRFMGPLPAAGQWVRLEVPASQLGLVGHTVTGMSFLHYDGRATWDKVGKCTTPPPPCAETVWFDDAVPTGATAVGSNDGWNWVGSNPTPFSGTLAHQSGIIAGQHDHFFVGATATLPLTAGDVIFAYVYLDPANMPQEIMLSFHDGAWGYRAYWGADLLPYGTNGTGSRRFMGPLPASGQWVRLEVPASQLGLVGHTVTGMSFLHYDGRATWDKVGKCATPPPPCSDNVWFDDAVPTGATAIGSNDGWNWVGSNPTPFSGTLAHQSGIIAGQHDHYFIGATATMPLAAGDVIFAYVYLDPANMPQEIMLSFHDGAWGYRAYWGADLLPYGTNGTGSRRFMGPLPPAGQWVRLAVPASLVGLEGHTVTGMSFLHYDGRATWDKVGKCTSNDVVWGEDAVPTGAVPVGSNDGWNWVSSNPAPYSGSLAHRSSLITGEHDHYFVNATETLPISTGDKLIAYVYLDPTNPPQEIMLSWNDGNWGFRAYWGANLLPYGTDGTNSRRFMGPLPPTGQWVRLEVPANLVGLEGHTLTGMSFLHYDGRATWDHQGKSN